MSLTNPTLKRISDFRRCGDWVEKSKAVDIQEDVVCYPSSRFIAQNSETRIVK